jgi:hypothetical protein
LGVKERREGVSSNAMTIQRSDALEIQVPGPPGIYPLSSMRPYVLKDFRAIATSVERPIVSNDVGNKEEEVKRSMV